MDDDENNPWRWIGTAQVGQPCEVIIGDRLGPMRLTHAVVLLEDGHWYNMEPPLQLAIRPVAWRYALQKQ